MKTRIKEIRIDKGLSQADFAQKLSVSRSAICKMESGENSPSEQTISLICREFNVSENWLRNGIGDMYIEISRDEQIAGFVGSVLATEEETFKKRFIQMLSQLDEDDWESLEKMVLLMSEKPEKD